MAKLAGRWNSRQRSPMRRSLPRGLGWRSRSTTAVCGSSTWRPARRSLTLVVKAVTRTWRGCRLTRRPAIGHRHGRHVASLPNHCRAIQVNVPYQRNRRRIALGEAPLMPIGIGQRAVWLTASNRADLIGREMPAHGSQVLPQLLLVACADDHGRHGRPREHPIDRDLRHGLARLGGNLVECVDDPIDVFVDAGGPMSFAS